MKQSSYFKMVHFTLRINIQIDTYFQMA